MKKIKIKVFYSSKWSNSLIDKDSGNTFDSMGSYSKPNKLTNEIDLNNKDTDLLLSLNKVYENYSYSPITHNTCFGIVSRIMGEIMPIKKILLSDDNEMNIYKDLYKSLSFIDNNVSRSNEIVSIHTKEKEMQNGGAGISEKNQYLITNNIFTNRFYNLLPFLQEIKNKINEGDNKVLFNLEVFFKILEDNKDLEEFDFFFKDYSINKINLNSFIEICKMIDEIGYKKNFDNINYDELNLQTKVLYLFNVNNLYSSKLIYKLINYLINFKEYSEFKTMFIDGSYGKNEVYIKGLAPNQVNKKDEIGGGSFTYREIFKHFSNKKKFNYKAPYIINIKNKNIFKNSENLIFKNIDVGLIKESGNIDITINMENEKIDFIYELIKNSGVNVINVGKKGLGYYTIEMEG